MGIDDQIISFFKQIHTIIKQNHFHKFEGAEQLKKIINDCFEMKKMKIRVKHDNKQWILFGDPQEIDNLDNAIPLFRVLYRHHALDYFSSDVEDSNIDLIIGDVLFQEKE